MSSKVCLNCFGLKKDSKSVTGGEVVVENKEENTSFLSPGRPPSTASQRSTMIDDDSGAVDGGKKESEFDEWAINEEFDALFALEVEVAMQQQHMTQGYVEEKVTGKEADSEKGGVLMDAEVREVIVEMEIESGKGEDDSVSTLSYDMFAATVATMGMMTDVDKAISSKAQVDMNSLYAIFLNLWIVIC